MVTGNNGFAKRGKRNTKSMHLNVITFSDERNRNKNKNDNSNSGNNSNKEMVKKSTNTLIITIATPYITNQHHRSYETIKKNILKITIQNYRKIQNKERKKKQKKHSKLQYTITVKSKK